METFDKVYEKMSSFLKKSQGEQNAWAKVYSEFSERRERDMAACPHCIPGREGTKQMLRILNKICSQNAKAENLATLEELANVVEKTCRCKLCKKSVSPVLSTLHDFRKKSEMNN